MAFELNSESFNIETKTHNSIDFTLEVGNSDLVEDSDKVLFVVKKNVNDIDYVFQKEFTTFTSNGTVMNTVTISLTSAEVQSISKGNYIYEVVYLAANGKVHTLIPDGVKLNYSRTPKFTIIQGVYSGE